MILEKIFNPSRSPTTTIAEFTASGFSWTRNLWDNGDQADIQIFEASPDIFRIIVNDPKISTFLILAGWTRIG